jgi:hypothetical protein
MDGATRRKLQAFAAGANWFMPHPLDIRRFSKFIIEAYERDDTTLSSDEFYQVVKPYQSLTGRQLDEWMDRYEQGIYLLKVYNNP